ncbi:MAG TPA: cation diffusion facilitator family transporter [Bacteroidia bacterium]|jgi:cobalt-zinc-cadmium efflux system protein|nr:cation diffusion facilitator family transporter [Bacteroidia bacterium]
MGHDHSHHHHGHSHEVQAKDLNGAFIIGIVLNALFVVVEVIIGFSIHSLSLLADAGHNLADVGALALSLLAFRLLASQPTKTFTYGFKKTSVLVALLNAFVLLISIGAIVYEATQRFFKPEPLPGITIAIVAGIGIVINASSALLFRRNKENDLNVKGAYLHLMSDAVVSLGLVIGGILIYFTQLYWLDSLLSIVVAAIILLNTWNLLKDSLRLSLDGVPANIEIEDIRKTALKVKGVKDLHHIHVWALSTSQNALTAHLVLHEGTTVEEEVKIKHELRHQLEHKNINHVTLETERGAGVCEKEEC